jgi:hypothetical protein
VNINNGFFLNIAYYGAELDCFSTLGRCWSLRSAFLSSRSATNSVGRGRKSLWRSRWPALLGCLFLLGHEGLTPELGRS